MTTVSTSAAPDGRRQRSEGSKQAIIEAMLEMIGEGILIPSAQQVSDRAGVDGLVVEGGEGDADIYISLSSHLVKH